MNNPRNAAVLALLEPIPDRERNLLVCGDSIMLVDDSGGEDITSYDLATACHYFLVWFQKQIDVKASELEARRRRSEIKLIDLAQKQEESSLC